MESPKLMATIDDLIPRARAGDRDAENTLFERLHARVLAHAKKKIWDQEAALDISQETLRTVFEKYREADLARGFFPWVFTILHNKVGNYLKRRRAEVARRAAGDPDVTWETVGVTRDGEIAAIDLAESLGTALRRATPECRKVFSLLLAEASREEMRRSFGGEPLGTTDSRISRCRERLLGYLEDLWKEIGR
jgi:RNA polymerase sigma factor (sigma-70 family)